MNRKVASGIMLTLPLIGILTFAFNIQPTEATGTIYIRADGSIEPPTAPISSADNITYTFTDNINDSIVVERSSIVIDGAGYTLQGVGVSYGIYLSGIVSNVTVKNTNIKGFDRGVFLDSTSLNVLSGNNLTDNFEGINLWSSSNISISGNNIIDNEGAGIVSEFSSNNSISENSIANGCYGIGLHGSNNIISGNNIRNEAYGIAFPLERSSNYNTISENSIADGSWGILLSSCSNNSISANNITSNEYGILLFGSSNNTVYHNNFVDNTKQVYIYESTTVWDDGYPSGGNCWSDYTGLDLYSGPYQNETGSDEIGDTPYIIDGNNQDRYPLLYSSTKIVEVTPCDRYGNPRDVFERGSLGCFNMVVNKTAIWPSFRETLLTINIYDSNRTTIGVASIQGPLTPGVSRFILCLPIPASANLGTATVHANAYTDWPHKGGVPYCPEVSATFQITGP